MLSRRLATCATVLTVAALGLAPAHAATKAKAKPKPKPIVGSYSLTLYPDPTTDVMDVASIAGAASGIGCEGVSPQGKDSHPFKIPAAGTLHVVLDSPDPTGNPTGMAGTDWDLHIVDADGSELDTSAGATSHEETTDTFKKAQSLSIDVCNLLGEPNATVSFTFTYA